MREFLQITVLLAGIFIAPAEALAQLLIADYPLATNSNDLTGNFAPILYGTNGTPPPVAACANGLYEQAQGINNGFGTFSTPPLDALFNHSNFEIDFDFTANSVPTSDFFPMPVLTMGPLFRTIGVCISQAGFIGILYNNSQYLFSNSKINTGQNYSVSLQYLAPSYKLLLNNSEILNGNLPALTFSTPPFVDDIKLYACNGSNGRGFNGCLSKLKVYSCPVITPAITISTADNTICKNGTAVFTATAVNGGMQPVYQWKINGNNAGTNSAVFTAANIKSNDVVSCSLTSNAVCANPATTNSNTIQVIVKPDPIINNDTALCANATLQLKSVNALSYQWSPSDGLNSTNIQNPVFSAGSSNSSKTYFLTTTDYSGNMVINPGFEQGNTDFITSYTNCTTGNCLFPLADNGYSVGTDANFFHAFFSGKDHTTGSGNFMIINGARPDLVVWKQTIAVTPNTDYAFGTWISTLIAQNTASIRFSINGVQLGDIFAAPANPNQWVRYFTKWNSGNNTSATIEIVDVFSQASGNDFGLDDIFFGKIVSCTDSVKVTVSGSYDGLPDTTKVCAGSTVLNAGTGFNSYQWSTGATAQTITVTQTGLYKVKVGNGSCSFSDSTFVSLQPVIVINKKDSICFGQVYISPTGKNLTTTGIYKDTLRNRDGCDSVIITTNLLAFAPTVNSINKTICDGSSYTLPSGKSVNTNGVFKDTLKYNFGCDSIITNLTLTVIQTITKETAATVCSGQSFTLPSGIKVKEAGLYADTTRSVSGCDSVISIIKLTILSNSASSAAVSLCTGQSYRLPSGKAVSNPGIYKDSILNSSGCDSIITITVTVKPPLIVSLSNPPVTCSGDPVTIAATASGGNGGPFTYKWSAINGNTDKITIAPLSTTVVMVSVSDGCTVVPAADTVTLTVNPKPIPAFTVNNEAGCTMLETIFTNSTQPASGNTYHWNFGDGFVSGSANASHVYTNAGSYNVTLFAANANGCTDSIKVSGAIKVYNKPQAAFEISPLPSPAGNLKFDFTDRTIGADYWKWDFGDSTGRSTIQNPSYTYRNAGVYTVSLVAGSSPNCTDTVFHPIEIQGYNGTFIPTAFSPNGDGINDVFRLTAVGIISTDWFRIFNRYGVIVFETTNLAIGWDGTYKGQKQAVGNYVWSIKGKGRNGKVIEMKGNVVLMK